MTAIKKTLNVKENIVISTYILLQFLGVAVTFLTVVGSGDGVDMMKPESGKEVSSATSFTDMVSFTIGNLASNFNPCSHTGGRMFLWYLVFYVILVLFGATDEGYALPSNETEWVKASFYISTIGFPALALIALIMYVNTSDQEKIRLYRRTYILAALLLFLTLAIFIIVKITTKTEEIQDANDAAAPAAPASALPKLIKQNNFKKKTSKTESIESKSQDLLSATSSGASRL